MDALAAEAIAAARRLLGPNPLRSRLIQVAAAILLFRQGVAPMPSTAVH